VEDGTPFGRYRLLELIGRGEMGETWRAFDTVTQRTVAVTVLPAEDAADTALQERFRQEIGSAAVLDYPAYAPQSGIVVEYPLYGPSGPFPTDPADDQPPRDDSTPPGPKKSRKGRLIGFSSAAAIAVTVAVVAAVVLTGWGEHRGAPHASPGASPTTLANTGPFTGTFTVQMGVAYLAGGEPYDSRGARAYTETWRLRSACSANGCVAIASAGDTTHYDVSDLVFDNVGGRWLAVAISHMKCLGKPDDEAWNVVSLVPQPDGRLSGEATRATANGCFIRRTATFTRKGDTDIAQLDDPARVNPRKVSPAEALHGRYDSQTTYANGYKTARANYGVRTDCLRTGDRCMSMFIKTNGSKLSYVFANGAWVFNKTYDSTCSVGGTNPSTFTETLPLPQPPQDPITSLIGHGYQAVLSGSGRCPSQAYDQTFTRTGD
jgi:hypothetical protein